MTLAPLTVALRVEEDVVAARQRARRLAERLGFDTQDQTRIATAVSEVARNAVLYAGGGRVEFAVQAIADAPALGVRVSDQGPGIADLDAVLEGRYQSPSGMGLGLVGTRRLMDAFRIESAAGRGTVVQFAKRLPRHAPVGRDALARISASLAEDGPPDPLNEARDQNRALLASLSELRARQEDLARLNEELEDTNRGVVALYAELDERAEELRRASELKSRFLSDMSHEFRTPLNSILALSRLMLDRTDGELTAEQERQVTFIRRSAESLSDLVNDLLDIAKVEAGKVEIRPRHFGVPELFGALRGVLKPLQVSDAVELVFDDVPPGPPLFTDEAKVSQILRNLISNALKFTERGTVHVCAQFDQGCDRYTFSVADTGIGIAPQDQERIFQEFVQVENRLQARVKGTGLGLALSRRLAELMGGHLTLRSEAGRGATFSLALPRMLDSAVGEVARTARDGRICILVIDDEEASRYLLRHMACAFEGAEVIEAADGIEGLKRAGEQRPDLIILDLHLPGGPDGFEILRRLGDVPETRDIPVVVCTSSLLSPAQEQELSRAKAILPKATLSKDSLLGLLRATFAGRVRP